MVTAVPGHGLIDTLEQKMAVLHEYHAYFTGLWNERVNATEVKGDLISMLAHNPATRNMEPREYFGNVVLLTVGGNDTTRNTITGSVLALNQNPDQYKKLRENPDLIASMVSETIRWQTPLAHMRRTATQDIEFQGKKIAKGDKVVMWYVSGNRDETVIERPNGLYRRPRESAAPHFLRLRHPPLRRQPAGGAPAPDHLGRDLQALPGDRGGRRAAARLLDLREGLRAPGRGDPQAVVTLRRSWRDPVGKFYPPLEGGSKFAQQISGRGPAARLDPSPKNLRSAPIFRPSLRGGCMIPPIEGCGVSP
ncbi:MAG: cytochrome P450 [Rhizomicrobium sp.]